MARKKLYSDEENRQRKIARQMRYLQRKSKEHQLMVAESYIKLVLSKQDKKPMDIAKELYSGGFWITADKKNNDIKLKGEK